MIKALQKTPKHWLTRGDCNLLFASFKKELEFDEPFPPFNTRFPGVLEGIISSVRQTCGKRYLNATVLKAAAAYFNQLVRGHAFLNGNKRMAVLYTHYFLLRHRVDCTLKPKEMYNFAVQVAIAGARGISSNDTKNLCQTILSKFTANAKL